jgi:hypothetical protein
MHRQPGMMVIVHRTSEEYCLLVTISFSVLGPMDNNLLKLHS